MSPNITTHSIIFLQQINVTIADTGNVIVRLRNTFILSKNKILINFDLLGYQQKYILLRKVIFIIGIGVFYLLGSRKKKIILLLCFFGNN